MSAVDHRRIVVFGATSAIAQAVLRLYVGAAFFLVGRSEAKLQRVAADLRTRGAVHVDTAVLEASDLAAHEAVWRRAHEALGDVDILLIAHAGLAEQGALERSFAATEDLFRVTFLSVAAVLTHAAGYFEARRAGSIVVISSVAGERGRKSNYVYGAAKAAVTVFTDGLRHRLYASGVHVLTIKPGLVDTPMTSAMKKGALFSTPQAVARGIKRAIDRRADSAFVPRYWCLIMAVIRALPEAIFKRTRL